MDLAELVSFVRTRALAVGRNCRIVHPKPPSWTLRQPTLGRSCSTPPFDCENTVPAVPPGPRACLAVHAV